MIDELPLWLSILVSVCVVLGAGLTMAGCLGLVRFPTMGTSMGGGLILVASAIFFTVTQQRLVIHEMVIFLFVTVTTPVTLMLLARATLFRDRIEEARDTPPSDAPKD